MMVLMLVSLIREARGSQMHFSTGESTTLLITLSATIMALLNPIAIAQLLKTKGGRPAIRNFTDNKSLHMLTKNLNKQPVLWIQ